MHDERIHDRQYLLTGHIMMMISTALLGVGEERDTQHDGYKPSLGRYFVPIFPRLRWLGHTVVRQSDLNMTTYFIHTKIKKVCGH
jgi:hypothetical protein